MAQFTFQLYLVLPLAQLQQVVGSKGVGLLYEAVANEALKVLIRLSVWL